MIHFFKPSHQGAADKPLLPRGGRGVVLLGFGVLSLLMAVSYISGPALGFLAVWPPVPRGLMALEMVGGMRFWGGLWLITGGVLLVSAFRRSQAVAMSCFSFMVSVWMLSYLTAFIKELTTIGSSSLWLSTGVYAALLMACIGLARMMDTPPLNTDAILRRLKQLEEECPPSAAIGGHGAK